MTLISVDIHLIKCSPKRIFGKMTSLQVVSTSGTKNTSSQEFTHPDDHTTSRYVTSGFKPFLIISFLRY